MKKIFGNYFEKNDLLKLVGIFIVLIVILSWIVPTGYYANGEFVTQEITRIGLIPLMTHGLSGISFFFQYFTFFLVLGFFYEVISRTAGYQEMVNKVSSVFK